MKLKREWRHRTVRIDALRNSGHIVTALFLASLSACSSCPPFRASWYLADSKGEAQQEDVTPPLIYLALLNEGTSTTTLKQVIVNPEGGITVPVIQRTIIRATEPAGHLAIEPPRAEAARSVHDGEGRLPDTPWRPGELLVFRVKGQKSDGRCSLPVVVRVECDAGCAKTQLVSGVMPNYLHKAWVEQCQPLKATTP